MDHADTQTVTQGHNASTNGDVKSSPLGHPPQPEDPEWKGAYNTGVAGIPFYTPAANPTPGTAFPTGDKPLPKLFEPWKLRGVEFKNRILVSPMCQYSAATGTGMPTDWHLVHQGQFAIRGAALVMTEATAVTPDGMISPEDLGIWSDDHIPAYKRIVDFIHSQGAKAGLQLAHAGRKGSTFAPWITDDIVAAPTNEKIRKSSVVPKKLGGFDTRGPSALAFSEHYPTPREMSIADIEEIKEAFVQGARRALEAGYDLLEIHFAHGYGIHNFLSPLSNKRTDKYGGSLENRLRFGLEIASAIRSVWPADKPLFCRVSATDWHEGGEGDADHWISWGPKQTAILAEKLKELGVDLIDVSSGGNDVGQKIPVEPGYQVPFAAELKKNPALNGLMIGSVGLITSPQQAEDILQSGKADVISLARELLRNADFVPQAADALGVVIGVPNQYQRAYPRMYKKLHE